MQNNSFKARQNKSTRKYATLDILLDSHKTIDTVYHQPYHRF